MVTIDSSTPVGARALERLESEIVAWLVTVDGAGSPQPSPIWFLPYNDQILIYSQDNVAKLRNIERNPRVALHFNGDQYGNDIIIFTGVATIDRSLPSAIEIPAYVEKYGEGITSIKMTNQSFADEYSVPILVDLRKLRGHYS